MKRLEQIKEQIKVQMSEKIHLVLDGKSDYEEIYFCRPNDIIKHIEMHGGKRGELDNFNGWQWDYCITIVHNKITYEICGDGYYQNYLTFFKSEEQD